MAKAQKRAESVAPKTRPVLRLFVDTCVWLDLAKDIHGQPLIVALRLLVHQGDVELLVPHLVIDEFDRNKERIGFDMIRSTSAQLRLARAAVEEHGRGEGRQRVLDELDSVTHREPLIRQMALRNFTEVRDLLEGGRPIESTAINEAKVVRRALTKEAPFHRAKISVADALLIEMYGGVLGEQSKDPAGRFAFVTHNTKDFSQPDGDDRVAHGDFAAFFLGPRSKYYISLPTVLAATFPGEFEELLEENDFPEDPRDLTEIMAEEQRLFDLIWYQRSISHMDPLGSDARARLEVQYGEDGLGPYTDFEWGMLNGKLSALRWLLGDEWDFLDT
jgi:hypothetical protein